MENATWLSSSNTFLRANGKLNTDLDGSLVLNETYASSGSDRLGEYQTIGFKYVLNDDQYTSMIGSVITYSNYNLVRFTQVFIK